MPLTVYYSDVAGRGRGTSFTFLIVSTAENAEKWLGKFDLNEHTAVVWFKLKYSKDTGLLSTSVKFKKHKSVQDLIVNLHISCENLGFSKKFCCYKYDLSEYELGDVIIPLNKVYLLKINTIVSKKEKTTFANLNDDTALTDFFLSCDSGRVAVHKVCLAVHSDTFKTMLEKKWKETEQGYIEIKDVTLQTLQDLKNYIYLRSLPKDLESVGPLLQLAKCYLMKNLKEDCLMVLATKLSGENLYEYQEYALKYNISELSCLLLELATDDIVKDARKFKNSSKPEESGKNDESAEMSNGAESESDED